MATESSTARRCDKPNCGDTAAASLAFRYDTGEVWIHDLADEPHPSRYDLCHRHAEHLTVPRGWQRVDERTAPVHSIAPAVDAERAADQVAVGGAPAHAPAPRRSYAGDRYAQLSAELPRLAAQVATDDEATGDDDPAAPGAAPAGGSPVGPPATSRGLSPADVPGAGGVVLDFFDRPRERAEGGEAPGDPDRPGAIDPDQPGAIDPDRPDPDDPDWGPIGPT